MTKQEIQIPEVGFLPYAVGKQPSIPLINLGKNGRKADDDDRLKL